MMPTFEAAEAVETAFDIEILTTDIGGDADNGGVDGGGDGGGKTACVVGGEGGDGGSKGGGGGGRGAGAELVTLMVGSESSSTPRIVSVLIEMTLAAAVLLALGFASLRVTLELAERLVSVQT
jgi:hypothetical protein